MDRSLGFGASTWLIFLACVPFRSYIKLPGLKGFSELCFGLVFVLGCGAGSHGFRVSDLGWAVSAERPIIHALSPKPQSPSPKS